MEEIEEKMKEVKYSEINKRIKIETITNFEKTEEQREKYKEIYLKNKKTIKRFKKNLFTLIKNQEESWETKKQIGSFLDTRRLADPKNRIWKKKEDKKEVADLCIQLMIDGSGSMRCKLMSVIEATVIFYEVAKALNIPISVIEERAMGGHPLVHHKILIDYINYKKNNIKYNILQLDSLNGTREGVSLKWIGARQNLQPYKDKLLIVLADGIPNHQYDNYRGEVAVKDTKKAAEQLEKIGINLIAVALERSCYKNLSRIYNNVVLCDNLNKLPEQMIKILKKFVIK
jgi:nitric oxide reductase activation protein